MPLPDTGEKMPRSMGGEPCRQASLSIPSEKMPLAMGSGGSMESPLSVDSPLPGRS